MNDALVLGCAAAGLVGGVVLDDLAARVPPAPRRAATEPAALDGTAPLALRLEEAEGPAGTADLAEPPTPVDPRGPESAPSLPAAPGTAERVGVGIVTAVLLGAAAARIGPEPELAAYCVLFCGLVAMSVADVRVGLVPRKFLYPTLIGVAVGLLAASAVESDWHRALTAVVSGVVAFAVFFVVWFIAPRALGFGDVRLAGLIGLSLGWLGYAETYLGFLAAFVIGAVIGVAKMVVSGTGRRTALPFGPALALGAVVGVLWGPHLAHLWLHQGS